APVAGRPRPPAPPRNSAGGVSQATGEGPEAGDKRAHEPDLGAHTANPMLCGMGRSLVVKVTAGTDAPERCSQAFTVAATAVASGVSVSLWLTGESAWFALPGRAAELSLPHAAPLPDLLTPILAGGPGTLCPHGAGRPGSPP